MFSYSGLSIIAKYCSTSSAFIFSIRTIARHRLTSPTTSSWLLLLVPAVNSGLLTLRLWWSGLPDARRPRISRGSCTRLEQPPASCRRCAVTSFLPEPLEDMAVWTDTDLILRLHFISFLSASLYFSKRGAYWDRLCRDVVGRWLSRACTVAKRYILGL